MDGNMQSACEIFDENTKKRWFRGEESGAYPIDELTVFHPFPTPPEGTDT